MIDFLTRVLTTTIYVAGIGSLILVVPTIIFLYLESKKKNCPEYHHHNLFLAVMAVALFAGLFFNMV